MSLLPGFFNKTLAFTIPCFLFFGSCKLDYDLGISQEEQSFPDIVMDEVEQVEVQGDRIIFIESQQVNIFSATGETHFIEIQFDEMDKDMQIQRSGAAGEIIQYENDDIDLNESILVTDHVDNSSIEAESLSWKDDQRLLSGPDDQAVSILWDGKNRLSGQGFNADFSRNEIRFNSAVEGEFKE